jgi:hypothetical protein
LVLVAAVLLLGEPAAAVTRAAVLLLRDMGEPAAAVTSISNMSGRTIDDS